MVELNYNEALKRGQKEFRACVARGVHPYLPRLDEILPPEKLSQGTDLGLVQVPLELVTGTVSGGREHAFARNFMPLMPVNSEFGDKWKSLCQAHLDEGIRDAVKAVEVLNRFYIEEGNKRVSVLKYFGAATVLAQVRRILPERTRETEWYWEFMEFYQKSRLNFPEFSRPGSYQHLSRLLGREAREPWTDEERSAFTAAYHYFQKAFVASGGRRLEVTVGDALLSWLEIYGYPALRSMSETELRKTMPRVWEEFALRQEAEPIEVKLTPGEEKKPGLLSKAFARPIRAAFLHDKTPELSGWTWGHELGRQHVERVFQGQIETAAYCNALEGEADAAVEQAIRDGYSVIFTTSPRLLPASLRAAIAHPEITVLNCSLNTSHRYIRTYYARIYEAKFVIGAIAGSLARNEDVGYLCDYPIFGQVAGINAFALGVQMVNPTARVFLEWSSVGGAEQAVERLRARGVRLISALDRTRLDDKSGYGLALLDGESRVILARPVWNWGVYYETLLRAIRDKTLREDYEESGRALNYYWGMSAGVVGVECSEKLPEGTKTLSEVLCGSICAGLCDPFHGPLHTQDGALITRGSEVLGMERIMGMDWLNENVVGAIPAYQELDETGRATVDIVGVEPSTREKEE